MIICTIDRSSILDGERVAAIAAEAFGPGSATLSRGITPPVDYRVAVEPQTDPPFSIRQLRAGTLSIDGTESQDARFAAALRAALPASYVRIVAIEAGASAYVDLVAGITPETIRSGWRPVEEGGFDEMT